ncbi:MAG: TRAP transporter substrate-binding protein [Rhodospirillaceae bacterium]|nr:TRAP transporter substrate-binding protein [Rhodospirillaceae bacterium]
MINRAMLATAGGLIALAAAQPAAAQDVTLTFAHFWPAVSATQTDLFEAWANRVSEESDGRIAVEIYPSAALAAPPAQYEAVISGIADMTATVLGYTANRFPLTQVVELPGISRDAAHGSCILQGLYDEGLLDSEFEDTHPLFLFTHGPGHIHTTDVLVQEPSDLAGLRIRRPTTVVASLLEGLGAQPVGMPAPESYTAMQRGVIDGVALPWEGAFVFRLNELATNHTEVGGLYTLAFVVTMNRDVYEGLPDDLRAVIDDNTGSEWSQTAASVFDALDVRGRADAEERGHTIYTVEGGIENPAWQPLLQGAAESYVAELEAQGLPGQAVYDRALELAETCE